MTDFKPVKIFRRYQIIKIGNDRFRLVRVLKEYTNRNDAVRDLQRLLRNEIDDRQLENE